MFNNGYKEDVGCTWTTSLNIHIVHVCHCFCLSVHIFVYPSTLPASLPPSPFPYFITFSFKPHFSLLFASLPLPLPSLPHYLPSQPKQLSKSYCWLVSSYVTNTFQPNLSWSTVIKLLTLTCKTAEAAETYWGWCTDIGLSTFCSNLLDNTSHNLLQRK